MGASVRPEQNPADLWDALVKQGVPPDSATKMVAQKHGAPPVAAPRDVTVNQGVRPSGGMSASQTIDGIATGINQGATFGLADEMAALAAGIVTNPRHPLQHYDKLQHQADSTYKAFKKENGGLAAASEIGGAILPGVMGGAIRTAAGVAPRVAGEGLLSRLLTTGKHIGEGALAGGAMGAGMAEPGQRIEGATSGALTGAGTVAGFKAAGKLASATGVTTLAKNLIPRAASAESRAGQLSQAAGVMTHQELARADLLKQLQRAGLALDEVDGRIAAAHPEQMLLDEQIGGKSMLRRARGVQSIPSRGSEQVESALVSRNEGAPKRIQSVLETESGHTKDNAVLRAEQLQGERSATAATNYPKAYAAPPIDDPEILSIFKDDAFQQAHAAARRMAARDGVDLPPLTRTVDIGGEKVTELVPQPVQAFDWMKHGLDDVIETGANGTRTMGRNEARITRKKLSEALSRIDAMPEHAPYAEARRAFREGSQVMEGQELGSKLFHTKNDEIAAAVPRLPASAQDEFRRAALGATEEKLAGVADGQNAASALTKNDLLKDKLRHLFPTPEAADRAFKALGDESAMHRNATFVLKGSPTARILAEQADEMGGPGVADVTNAFTGNVSGLLTKLMTNSAAARMRGLSEAQTDALAPLLIKKGTDLSALMTELRALAQQQSVQRAAGSRTTRAIGQTAGGSNP